MEIRKFLERDFSVVRNNLKISILDICNLFGGNFNGGKEDNLSEKFHGVCADDFVRFKKNSKTEWLPKRLVRERVMDVERSVSEAVDLIQKNRTDLFKILCSTGNVSVPKNFVLKYSEKEMNLFLDSVLEKYEKGNWMEKRGAKINLIKFLISDFVGIEFALSVVGSELYNYFAEDLKDKVGLTFINFQAFLKDKNNWKYTKRFTGVKYKIDCDDVRFVGTPLTLGEILEKKFMGNVPLKLESLLKVFGINTIESDWYVLFNDETNWVEEYQWYVLLCNKIVKFFTSSRSGTSVVSLGEDEMKEIKSNLEEYILSDKNKNIKDEIKTNIEIINMAIEDAGAEVYIYNLGSLKFSKGWQNKKRIMKILNEFGEI